MSDNRGPRGRLQFLLLALLFAAPLLMAMLFYFVPGLQPVGRVNYGTLVRPAQPLPADLGWVDHAAQPVARTELQGRWTLVYPAAGDCDEGCVDRLFQYRQMRALLNEKRLRVQRVVLVDAVGALAAVHEALQEAQPDLHFYAPLVVDNEAARLFDGQPTGSVWMVDPLGNVMMVFPPDADLRKVMRDIKRLLRISQVG